MADRIQGPAIYCDGVTAARQSVTLTIEEDAITIAPTTGATLARWATAAIEPLPAPPDRLRLALTDHSSTARLDLRDPAFTEAVRQRLGFSTPQYARGLRRHRLLIIAWSAAAVAAVMTIGVTGLPAVAAMLVPFIPPAWDAGLGSQAHDAQRTSFMEKGPFTCGDEGPMERAGKAVFLRVIKQGETAANLPVPIRPFVIRTKVNNATAYPGGYVHVNMGLIDDTQSLDEFVGIIAHEFGHVAKRHGLKSILHRAGLAYLFGVALGDVFGRGALIIVGQQLLQVRNTRAQEAEADAYAVQLMSRLDADPLRFADFFERGLQRRGGDNASLLNDHPTDTQRIAAIRAAPRPANPTPMLNEADWRTLKQVCSRK